ncbi:MAG TPA: hypothetical protein VLL48_08985, partial [Longimicrobiales bacterium]|nr:hypothetical protein [Longimicrobiales bacterium]
EDPRVEFRPYAPVRWEDVVVDGLQDADTLERLVDRIRARWAAGRAAEGDPAGVEWLVRVVLEGPTPLWRELASTEERRVVADEVAGRLDVLDVTVEAPTVHPVVPVEEHRGREDVLGEALRLVGELREGSVVLPVDPQELAGAEADGEGARSYVRSLLAGAEGEILARLLRPEE